MFKVDKNLEFSPLHERDNNIRSIICQSAIIIIIIIIIILIIIIIT